MHPLIRVTTPRLLLRYALLGRRPLTPNIVASLRLAHYVPPTNRSFLSFFRRRTPPPPPADSKHAYPSSLLIYYAGKRTIYLGTLKLYTVLLFSYCSLLVAPALLGAGEGMAVSFLDRINMPMLPAWIVPVAVVVGSVVPLAFVQYLSPSYVTHLYLRLPPWARFSQQHLLQYVRQLPSSAVVEVATIRWFGRPKVTRVKVIEMRMERARWGCVNVVVRRPGEKAMGFYVDWRGSPAVVKEKECIGEIGRAVRRWEEKRGRVGA